MPVLILGTANEYTHIPTTDLFLRNTGILQGLVGTFQEQPLHGVFSFWLAKPVLKVLDGGKGVMGTHSLGFFLGHVKEGRIKHLDVL